MKPKHANVLCTLKGIIAIENDLTRNGTNYTTETWNAILSGEDYQEMVENNSFYIGLDHPEKATRSTLVSLLKDVAGVVTSLVRLSNGAIEVVIDILDTPCGRIAATLAEYGCALGLSTRAYGHRLPGARNGEIDPDSITFLGADLVSQPSQKAGRLRLVLNESAHGVHHDKKAFLTEALDYAKGSSMDEVVVSAMRQDKFLKEGKTMKIVKGAYGQFDLAQSEGLLEGMKSTDNLASITSDGFIRSRYTGEDAPVLNHKIVGGLLEVCDARGQVYQFEVETAPTAMSLLEGTAHKDTAGYAEQAQGWLDDNQDTQVAGAQPFLEWCIREGVESPYEPSAITEYAMAQDVGINTVKGLMESFAPVSPSEVEFRALLEGISSGLDDSVDGSDEGAEDPDNSGSILTEGTDQPDPKGKVKEGAKDPLDGASKNKIGKIEVKEDDEILVESVNPKLVGKIRGKDVLVLLEGKVVEAVKLEAGDNLLESMNTLFADHLPA